MTATYGESRADLRGCGRGRRQKASDGNRVESEHEWQQARIFVELKKRFVGQILEDFGSRHIRKEPTRGHSSLNQSRIEKSRQAALKVKELRS